MTFNRQEIVMIITMSIDFFGKDEELAKWDKARKKACDDTEGCKYMGRYTSHQARYHWTYFFEADSYDRFMEALGKVTLKRDRNETAHAVIEIFSGPLHS